MDFFEILLILVSFFLGACVQRFYHILEESGVTTADPIKSWSKSMSMQSKRPASSVTSPKGSKRVHGDEGSEKTQKIAKKLGPSKNLKKTPPKKVSVATSSLTPGMTTSTDSTTTTTTATTASILPTATTQSETPPPMEATQQVSALSSTLTPATVPTGTITTTTNAISPAANSFTEVPVSPGTDAAPLEIVAKSKRIRPATLCDCGLELINERERYNDDIQMPDFDQPVVFANKILIYPISYEHYRAVSLVHPPTGQSTLSPFVTKRPFTQETVNILTPFKPLLHSLYYAHRHAIMIEDLLTNYQYLED